MAPLPPAWSGGGRKGRPCGLGPVQLSVELHTVALGFRCIVCAFLFNLSVIEKAIALQLIWTPFDFLLDVIFTTKILGYVLG